ncbi:MAG: YlxR family protein [Anaerolineae bacterium]|nr:YlxR family protein [Anaerolineae bacterium]
MTAKHKAVRHKHIPQRSCAVCRQVCPKRELTRLVISPEAGIQVDTSGKAPGRGAYLCGNPVCWERAAHGEVLSKALRTNLTEQDRVRLSAHMAQLAPQVQSNHD